MNCPVNHDERRNMGLLACYHCGEYLQSIDEANEVRERLGMTHRFGADRVLYRSGVACPTCHGSGIVYLPVEPQGGGVR